ncbi:MAG: hypothetical protein ABIO44_08075 [Saprospiraceae bacterium]
MKTINKSFINRLGILMLIISLFFASCFQKNLLSSKKVNFKTTKSVVQITNSSSKKSKSKIKTSNVITNTERKVVLSDSLLKDDVLVSIPKKEVIVESGIEIDSSEFNQIPVDIEMVIDSTEIAKL